jgi:hypothetical protein
VKLKPNENAPVIADWCPVCKGYRTQENGSMVVLTPMTVAEPLASRCATRCVVCGWLIVYS